MVIALKGHAVSHAPQPVQAPGSCKVDDLTQPRLSSDSACGRQAATHRPHPVQRSESISGRAVRFEITFEDEFDWSSRFREHRTISARVVDALGDSKQPWNQSAFLRPHWRTLGSDILPRGIEVAESTRRFYLQRQRLLTRKPLYPRLGMDVACDRSSLI